MPLQLTIDDYSKATGVFRTQLPDTSCQNFLTSATAS